MSPTPPDDAGASPDDAGSRPARPPGPLLVACLLVLLQAAVLVGLAVGFSADLVRGRTQLAGATLFLVVFTLALAAALVLAARALWRGRRWGRAPVLTWQLLLVVMAVGWIRAEPTVWAAAILASAVVVIVTLLLPRVVSVTTGRAPDA